MPMTFIIRPLVETLASREESASSSSSWLSSVVNFTQRQVKRVFKLGWHQSEVVMICPVLKRHVPGAVFKISLPTKELKNVAWCLKWGAVALKIALASQGLGGIAPDVSQLLPGVDIDAAHKVVEDMEATMAVADDIHVILEGERASSASEHLKSEIDSLADGKTKKQIRDIYNLIAKAQKKDPERAFEV